MADKKDSNEKEKKKGKLVLAKDKKQAGLAIIVVIAFLCNTLYMIVKAVQENIKTKAAQQQALLSPTQNQPEMLKNIKDAQPPIATKSLPKK